MVKPPLKSSEDKARVVVSILRGEVTRSMDEALADTEDQNDRWLGEAGRDTLQRSEW